MTWFRLARIAGVGALLAFLAFVASACFLDFDDPSNAPVVKRVIAASLGVFTFLLVASGVCAVIHWGGIPGWVWRGRQGELRRSEHPVLYWMAVAGLAVLLLWAAWVAMEFILHGESLGT